MMDMDPDWVLGLVILKGTASSMAWVRCCSGAPSDLDYSGIPGICSCKKRSSLSFPEVASDCSRQSSKKHQNNTKKTTKKTNQLRRPQAGGEDPCIPNFPCFYGQQPIAEVGWVPGYERQTERGKICRIPLTLPSPLTMVLLTETHLGSIKYSLQMGLLALLYLWHI